jgi:fatty acid desaturase
MAAFVLAALIAWGIRRDLRIVWQIGTAGAVLYLLHRLVDWFWDWVPQWLFFLIVGGFALAVLFVLRWLHRRMREGAATR